MAYSKNFDRQKYEQEQQQAREAMQAQIKEIGASFSLNPDVLADYYKFASRFHTYSHKNQMLIYAQNPYATFVGSFKSYQDKGYSVKKGEHGLKIFVPVTATYFQAAPNEWKKLSEATKEEKQHIAKNEYEIRKALHFKIGTVFDISQTNVPASEYPKFYQMGYSSEQHSAVFDAVKYYCERDLSCPVDTVNLQSISLHGHYIPSLHKIELNEKMEDSLRLSTCLHEMGHAIMHNDSQNTDEKTLPQIEFEADSISIMLQSHFGFDIPDKDKLHLSKQYKALAENDVDIDQVLNNVSDIYAQHVSKISPLVDLHLKNPYRNTPKRYRDEQGVLTLPLEQVCAETLAEANDYYQTGEKYYLLSEGANEYICTRWVENGDNHIRFDSVDNSKHIHCDPGRMGTFLPNVATRGNEIIRVSDLDNEQKKNAMAKDPVKEYCNQIALQSANNLTMEMTI